MQVAAKALDHPSSFALTIALKVSGMIKFYKHLNYFANTTMFSFQKVLTTCS